MCMIMSNHVAQKPPRIKCCGFVPVQCRGERTEIIRGPIQSKISTLITGLIRTLSASVWECFGCVRCVQGADPCRSGRTLQSLHHHRYLIGSKEPPVFCRSRREPFPHDMQASGPAGKTHRRDDHQSKTTLLDFTHLREREREKKEMSTSHIW